MHRPTSYSDSGGSRNIGSSKKVITPHSRKRAAHKDSVEDSSDNEADKENTPENKKKKTEQLQEPESILTRTGDERSITGV